MEEAFSSVPVRAVEVLDELERQVGDSEACRSFARDFISQWETRHAMMLRAHRAGVLDQFLHAVASLEASSVMLGLMQLSGLCKALRERVAEDDPDGVRHLLYLIRNCGAVSVGNLQQSYLKVGTEAVDGQ